MKPIHEFELELKELDEKFEIIPHPVNTEFAGVYYDRATIKAAGGDPFVITVPSQMISEERDPSHAEATGHPHNWATKVVAVCKEHLKRLDEDKEYKDLFYMKIPTRPIAPKAAKPV